jgi:L-2-hydroxyglutarate oxidase LhgO
MSETDLDVVIIGAGAVGLAIAAEVAGRFARVVLFERHDRFGVETSSRNSEVVHAGMYYPTGSLKARLCVDGRRRLYDLAGRHGVPFRRCGKLIVAVTEAEEASLEALAARGEANGVEGLRLLSAAEVSAREPHVVARAALLSSETGIVDSHQLMAVFRQMARERGAGVVFGAPVVGLDTVPGGWRVHYRDAGGDGALTARVVVNAGGLGAQAVMRLAGLDPDAIGLGLHLCKGEYFAVQGAHRSIVQGLVYPSPQADLVGLGIHTVIDLGGGLRLGPNAVYVDEVDYAVDPSHRDAFLVNVRPFLPCLEADDLAPAMAGVRPKLSGPGEPARDFHIAHEADHGAPGFFNLAGIESPGLTASPAIGRLVADLVEDFLTA